MKVLDPEILAFAGINPGETLRNARENKNWSQADVAVKLNLTVQALGHLESGDFAKLPGNTFARGYIRTYAKLLGIDQEPLVVAFDQLTGSNAAGSSVHALGRIEEPAHVAQNLLRVVSFLLLLALALASYFWWQDRSQGQRADTSISNVLEHIEVEGADGSTQIHPLDEPEDQAVTAGQESLELALPEVAPEVAAQPEITPVTPPPSAVASGPASSAAVPLSALPAVPVVAPQATAGDGLVSVQFTANCWAQLTDANGKVLFSALKRAGETLELAGKPPLELRLGFARGAQVSYNGQVVDVAPYTSGETARMKLGQ
ncbi:MAG: helix-turn-helix domain-containing protein [Pseudomonas sp.]|uniref:RodZ domain-containing protein n=1 Tax=Pseudomonas sp. TaxID=306 RepID=UPI002736DC4D|nr:RodZ family helix-turn-helix domain-containing protein [Pseudomonas sp.]MDP3848240.1 helix-turn-helix domain-containing protein [Pseudomonas sp.]